MSTTSAHGHGIAAGKIGAFMLAFGVLRSGEGAVSVHWWPSALCAPGTVGVVEQHKLTRDLVLVGLMDSLIRQSVVADCPAAGRLSGLIRKSDFLLDDIDDVLEDKVARPRAREPAGRAGLGRGGGEFRLEELFWIT